MKQAVFFRDFAKDEKWLLILSSAVCFASGFGIISDVLPKPWGPIGALIGVGLAVYYYRYLFLYKHYAVFNRVGIHLRTSRKSPSKSIRFQEIQSVEVIEEQLVVKQHRKSTVFEVQSIAAEDLQKIITILKHRKLN